MKTKEFNAKINKMIKELIPALKKDIENKVSRGGIDLDNYEDDFLAPKIVLSASLAEMAFQYAPHLKEDIKTMENLKHF